MKSLLNYFRLEHLYEHRQLRLLGQEGLIRLRDARKALEGQEQEIRHLYPLWTREGDQAVIDQLAARKPGAGPVVEFFTYRLKYHYDFLGHM